MDVLVSSLLGETATNLRRIFDFAAAQPVVLLLDEFDAIARPRDEGFAQLESFADDRGFVVV